MEDMRMVLNRCIQHEYCSFFGIDLDFLPAKKSSDFWIDLRPSYLRNHSALDFVSSLLQDVAECAFSVLSSRSHSFQNVVLFCASF